MNLPPPSAQQQQQYQRNLLRTCKVRGYSIQPSALHAILTAIQYGETQKWVDTSSENINHSRHGHESVTQVVHLLQEYMKHHYASQKVISITIWNEMMEQQQQQQLLNDSRHNHEIIQKENRPNDWSLHSLVTQRPTKKEEDGDDKEEEDKEEEDKEEEEKEDTPEATPHTHTLTSTNHEKGLFRTILPSTHMTTKSNLPSVVCESSPVVVITTFTEASQTMIPQLFYDLTRKQFHLRSSMSVTASSSSSLFGSVSDKIEMLAQRYALLYQRTLRHDLFRPTSILYNHPHSNQTSSSTQNQHQGPLKLTPIESLLGTKQKVRPNQSSHPPLVLLFGILLQIEEHVYYLEDMTGQIPISFQQYHRTEASTVRTSNELSFFLTEHAILLVEGYYNHDDGIFYIVRCGPPLQETRYDACKVISQQISHPAFQYSHNTTMTKHHSTSVAVRAQHHQDKDTTNDISFLLLQDLYMDQPRVVQQFEALLSSYEFKYSNTHRQPTSPTQQLPIFVLMGNFMSNSNNLSHTSASVTTSVQTMKSILEDLIGTIGKYTYLAKYGHFVIVPGPNDIAMTTIHNHHILPIPSFPKSMIHGLQKSSSSSSSNSYNGVSNLHFTSNPCRIRFTHRHHHHDDNVTATTNKEMVIFRYDLLQLFQQHQIRLKTSTKHDQDANTTMNVDQDEEEDDELMAMSDTRSSAISHNRRLLFKTILDQGCLIPISNVPMYWSYSHFLSLYPLPSCLVLADGSITHHAPTKGGVDGIREQYDSYYDCDIIQTISFSNHGNDGSSKTSHTNNGAHTIYRPTTVTTRNDDDDDDESDTSERIVEFGRVG